jgi:hypothetical protein
MPTAQGGIEKIDRKSRGFDVRDNVQYMDGHKRRFTIPDEAPTGDSQVHTVALASIAAADTYTQIRKCMNNIPIKGFDENRGIRPETTLWLSILMVRVPFTQRAPSCLKGLDAEKRPRVLFYMPL